MISLPRGGGPPTFQAAARLIHSSNAVRVKRAATATRIQALETAGSADRGDATVVVTAVNSGHHVSVVKPQSGRAAGTAGGLKCQPTWRKTAPLKLARKKMTDSSKQWKARRPIKLPSSTVRSIPPWFSPQQQSLSCVGLSIHVCPPMVIPLATELIICRV